MRGDLMRMVLHGVASEKHLRQISHRKAQAARLVKRLKSRKSQAYSFKSDEGTMELNRRSFPVD